MNKTRKKRALITGLTGQDGSYLASFLVDKNYEIYGLVRRSSLDPFARIEKIRLSGDVKILYGNMRDICSIERAIEISEPDEIYNLAAQSDVGISFQIPEETMEINYYGLGRLINASIRKNPLVRIYQASTSEMFGKTPPPQNEKTEFNPQSPYAESKMRAHQDFVESYRKKHNLFICSGILFNHESPKRGEHFVTRKITNSLARIKLKMQDYFELGNLDAKRDWGFAGDYVKAMWMMLQQNKPEDFVIATGKSTTVRDFVNTAAKKVGINIIWKGKGLQEIGIDENTGRIIVKVNKKFFRPADVNYLLGDSRKAQKKLGWKPDVSLDTLIEMMIENDLAIEKSKGVL